MVFGKEITLETEGFSRSYDRTPDASPGLTVTGGKTVSVYGKKRRLSKYSVLLSLSQLSEFQ
jgi:hypothetical protein